MRNAALRLATLGALGGTVTGLLIGSAWLDRWGWPGSGVALRMLAHVGASGFLVGVLLALAWLPLHPFTSWLGTAGKRRWGLPSESGLWAVGVLGFLALRVPAAHWLSHGQAEVPVWLLDPLLAVALGLLLLAARWAWQPPSSARGPAWLVAGLAASAVVGGLQLIELRSPGPETASRPRPNFLLIVVDCLRADHLGSYGYARATSPAIDRLAAHGQVYERASSTASWTKPAVASILTGRFAHRHGALRKSDALPGEAQTLAERLAGVGYRTLHLGGNAWISSAFGFEQGYDLVWMDPHSTAERLRERLELELAMVGERPFFAYVHFMDVHLPYSLNRYNDLFVPAGAASPTLSSGMLNSSWARRRTAAGLMSPQDRERMVGLYDGQIRLVDEQIGRMLATLRRRGQLRRTLVVLTADHGEEFWEHGGFEHGHSVYEELLHVPLIVAGLGIPPGRVVAPVSLVDLAPTLLALAGADARPEDFDGVPLREAARREGRHLYAASTLYGNEKFALFDGRRKLILNAPATPDGWRLVGRRAHSRLEAFDLLVDPRETDPLRMLAPLSGEWPSRLEAMRRATLGRAAPEVLVKEELFERFRALGYMD
ncbi:MAG: sulfatase [Myxococcota bacterium]